MLSFCKKIASACQNLSSAVARKARAGWEKFKTGFNTIFLRTTDAILRAVPRALAAKTYFQLILNLAGIASSVVEPVVFVTVFAITATTSFLGTQWWINKLDRINRLIQKRARHKGIIRRVIDALFRAISRGESVIKLIAWIALMCTASPAIRFIQLGFSLITLLTVSITSFKRNVGRSSRPNMRGSGGFKARCGKFIDCFTRVVNGRTIDAFYRALARAMSCNRMFNFFMRMFEANSLVVEGVATGITFIAASISSYNGTKWWTNDPEEFRKMRNLPTDRHRDRLQNSTETITRGLARGESGISMVIFLSSLGELDDLNTVKYSEAAFGLIFAVLGGLASFQRIRYRIHYAKAYATFIQSQEISDRADGVPSIVISRAGERERGDVADGEAVPLLSFFHTRSPSDATMVSASTAGTSFSSTPPSL